MDADNVVAPPATPAWNRPAEPPEEYRFFYRSQYRPMMVIAVHAGATWHEADEITAETLQKMHDHWQQLENPFAWVRRALISNLAARRRADTRRLLRQGRYLADTYERPPELHTHCLEDPDTREDLLSGLTERQRRVVELILQGLTHEEIGLLLGTAPDTVRRNLSNIRRRLDSRRGQYSATTPETNCPIEQGEEA